MSIRGRLAPSPTGALHLGNARTFLIAWLRARSANGKIILRMEDLDHPKVKPNAATEALEDLRWLGLDWDEGPDVGGPFAPYTQTQRLEHYAAALAKLREMGLVYPCVCSRKDVAEGQSAPHENSGLFLGNNVGQASGLSAANPEDGLFYPGTCREKFTDFETAAATFSDGRIPAWRFKVEHNTRISFTDAFCGEQHQRVDEATGDFVIARHALGAGYMLAVVVDDAAMQISEVVRGDDLLPATPRQLLLYRALGLPEPHYLHVPLVVAEDGRRLAKRHGDTRLRTLREAGVSAEEVLGVLAWWSGWAQWGESVALHDLLPRCDFGAIPRGPAVLDKNVRARLRVEN